VIKLGGKLVMQRKRAKELGGDAVTELVITAV